MPREPRRKSVTGIYHIILKGNNGQILFEEPEDYRYFITALHIYQLQSNCRIYAYCLMDNHVHLLIREGSEPLDNTLKRIEVKYAYYFNHKYERRGHLFQDRFKSRCVEDERYMATVLRYICNNPVKAGLVKRPSEYPWTDYSINGGIGDVGQPMGQGTVLCPTTEIPPPALNSTDDDIEIMRDIEKFDNADTAADTGTRALISDMTARNRILAVFPCTTLSAIPEMSPLIRDPLLKQLKAEGLTIRQISRLTGLSRSLVARA